MTADEKRHGDALQRDAREKIPPDSIWQHRKSRGIYTVRDVALLQIDPSLDFAVPKLDGSPVVLYGSTLNPGPFVRLCDEFLERFDRLA